MAALRREVESFAPRTEREGQSRTRILLQLGRLSHPFDRGADHVHVTGSGIVIGSRGTLLHWHKRLGGWLQPGGHLDPGEAPHEAARRETREETGLAAEHPGGRPRLFHLDVHPAAAGHVHLDIRYLLVAPDSDPVPPEGESQQVAWFSLAAARVVADPGLIDALDRLESLDLPGWGQARR